MSAEAGESAAGNSGAFGVNYALRPHKFVDRRVFLEVVNRYTNFRSIEDYVYVGLGSFAMEDHKLVSATFGTKILISLEIDSEVVVRQKFNAPFACIKPTRYSTNDFVIRKTAIFGEFDIDGDANSIVWFDMTDADTLRAYLDLFRELLRCSAPGDVLRITVARRCESFALDKIYTFEPISLTTYADGHRMLSITGVVIERENVEERRAKMRLTAVPGG